MAADPITAIASALAGIANAAQPFIEDHFAQLYEKQHQSRVNEWQGILAEQDSHTRADLMHEFMLRLLNQSGQAVPRGLSRNISVPLDILNSLVIEVSEGIKKDQILGKVRFK